MIPDKDLFWFLVICTAGICHEMKCSVGVDVYMHFVLFSQFHTEEKEQVRNREQGFLMCGQHGCQQIWKVLHMRESCAFSLAGLHHRHSCQQQPVAVHRITTQHPAQQ